MAANFKQGRRDLLSLMGAGALSSLGGCCALRSYPSDSSLPVLPPTVVPRLDPPIIPQRKRGPLRAIDAHTHIFNGNDVSVQGYLSHSIAHSMPNSALAALIRAIAPIADELVHLAPTAAVEYRELLKQDQILSISSREDTRKFYSKAAQEHKANVAQALYSATRGTEVERLYGQMTGRPYTPEVLSSAISGRADMATWSTQTMSVAQSQAAGVFEFVGHMLSPRWVNLRDFTENYAAAGQAFGIDGMLSATVDFDYFLCPPKRSSQQDQMQLAALLSLLSGGYMLPLTAYNPWTHVKEGVAYLDRIGQHITELGAVGVKIYPPMGFYPQGNAKLPPNPRNDVPSGRDLDSHLRAFFERCIDLGVPVMAHGNESCGYDEDADRFGGPAGWAELINGLGTRSPMVNIAHFGGDNTQANSKDWSYAMAGLMMTPGGERIFGDLGYWDALMTCDSKDDQRCVSALLRLNNLLKDYPGAAERIMYGSDWFMLSKQANWNLYPDKILNALTNGQQSLPYLRKLNIDRLFYDNVIACYGLSGGANAGANRLRVDQFFKRHGQAGPAWLPA